MTTTLFLAVLAATLAVVAVDAVLVWRRVGGA